MVSWTGPDAKPEPRVRDRKVYATFHARFHDCISCGHGGRWCQAHHILSRAQGGDDVLANLVGLCEGCHQAYHGSPYRAFGVRIDANHVRQALARYLRSEAGDNARWYLTAKLGAEGSLAFLERLEA